MVDLAWNIFVIVIVSVFVFLVVFFVRSYFLITLIKCIKGQKSKRSLLNVFVIVFEI